MSDRLYEAEKAWNSVMSYIEYINWATVNKNSVYFIQLSFFIKHALPITIILKHNIDNEISKD